MVRVGPSASSDSLTMGSPTAPGTVALHASSLPSSPMKQPHHSNGNRNDESTAGAGLRSLHVSSVVLHDAAQQAISPSTPPPLYASLGGRSHGDVAGVDALRRSYGTTIDDVVTDRSGLTAMELLPACLPTPDLRRLDLSVEVPRYGLRCAVPPTIVLVGTPQVVIELPLVPGGSHHSDDAGHAVEIPSYVHLEVTVGESGLDRAISYVVDVDVPDLFIVAPQVDAGSGALRFVVNPLASGATRCSLCAYDLAMINADNVPQSSNRLPFSITVSRVKHPSSTPIGQGQGLHVSGAGENTGGGDGGTNRTTETQSNPPPARRVRLATQGDFANTVSPEAVLRARHDGSNAVSHSSEADGGSSDALTTMTTYVFPPSNPHELRYPSVVFHNEQFLALQAMRGSTDSGMKPKCYVPSYDVPLSDLDLLRMGRSVREWDRLVGEPVKEATRSELEAKLTERIRAEEQRFGPMSADLCPLLLRLAQLHMAKGFKNQGDTVELLERIARIRLHSLGIDSFEALDSLTEAFLSHNGNHSMTAGTLGGTISSIPNGSILSAAAVALEDGEKDAAVQVKEGKLFDQFHQSLLLLCLYLKYVGRYRELLDFAHIGVRAAIAVHGDGSVQHLRSLSEMSEAQILLGNYTAASASLEMCIARSDVLFGPEAVATQTLMHTLGVCLLEAREYSRSVATHDRVLKARQKKADAHDQLSLAESYLLSAWARTRMRVAQLGDYRTASDAKQNPNEDRITEYTEAGLSILHALQSSESSPSTATVLQRSCLLVLGARIARQRKDAQRALALMQRAADDVSSARGVASVEAAMLTMAAAAEKLRQYPHGWDAPLAGLTGAKRVAEANRGDDAVVSSKKAASNAVSELQAANVVFMASLGHQHPFTIRCSVLLAEIRMFANPAQSATTIERCVTYVKRLLHPSHWDHVVVNRCAATIHSLTRQNAAAVVEAAAAHTVAMELNGDDDVLLVELESLFIGAMSRVNEMPSPTLLRLLEHRVTSCMQTYGETSEHLVRPLQNLAEAHYLCGDTARAHHALSRALKIADSVNFIFLLGNLLQPVAQLSVAEAQERNRISRDRMHSSLALLFSETLFQIAAVFDTEGKAEEAQSTYLQSLAAIEISGVGNSLGVVQILSALAMLLYSEGHYGDALAYGERAHSILLEHYPTMHLNIEAVTEILRVIHFRLRENGYALLRHPDTRHRFTSYL